MPVRKIAVTTAQSVWAVCGRNPGILAAKERRERIEIQADLIFALFAFLCG